MTLSMESWERVVLTKSHLLLTSHPLFQAITRLLSAYRSATEAKHMTEAMVEEQVLRH